MLTFRSDSESRRPLTWSLRLGEATTILNYFEEFIPLKRDSRRGSGDEM